MTDLKRELQQAQRPHYEDFILEFETDSEIQEYGINSGDLWNAYTEYCDSNKIDRMMRIKSPNGFGQKIRHLVRKQEVKRNKKVQTVYFLLKDDAKKAKRMRKQQQLQKAEEFRNKRLMTLAFGAFGKSQ
jgi:hypothetical protein